MLSKAAFICDNSDVADAAYTDLIFSNASLIWVNSFDVVASPACEVIVGDTPESNPIAGCIYRILISILVAIRMASWKFRTSLSTIRVCMAGNNPNKKQSLNIGSR